MQERNIYPLPLDMPQSEIKPTTQVCMCPDGESNWHAKTFASKKNICIQTGSLLEHRMMLNQLSYSGWANCPFLFWFPVHPIGKPNIHLTIRYQIEMINDDQTHHCWLEVLNQFLVVEAVSHLLWLTVTMFTCSISYCVLIRKNVTRPDLCLYRSVISSF